MQEHTRTQIFVTHSDEAKGMKSVKYLFLIYLDYKQYIIHFWSLC